MLRTKNTPTQGRGLIVILCGIIAFLALTFIGIIFFNPQLNANVFYAVFLDNGQVYFGRITKQTSTEVVLNNVFYLKASTDLSTQSTKELPDANLALVKLGQELYKPQDKMIINKDHVLFLEEMGSNSEIMNAIEKYENQNH